MHILVIKLASGRRKSYRDKKTRDFWMRNFFYLGFVTLYGILSVSTMNAANNWTLDGIWCWVKNPMDRIYYAYVALWVVIIVTVSVTIATVVRLRAILQSQESSGAINTLADKSTQNFYARMFIGPLLFIILHIPGSTRRLGQAFDFKFSPEVSYNLSMSQSFMDPLHGAVNFFLYVLLDRRQRKEWQKLFQNLYSMILTYSGYDTESDRKQSIDTSKLSMSSSSSAASNPIHPNSFEPSDDVDREQEQDVELNNRSGATQRTENE